MSAAFQYRRFKGISLNCKGAILFEGTPGILVAAKGLTHAMNYDLCRAQLNSTAHLTQNQKERKTHCTTDAALDITAMI